MSKSILIIFYHLFCQNKSDRAGELAAAFINAETRCHRFRSSLSNQKNLLVKGFTLIVHIRN